MEGEAIAHLTTGAAVVYVLQWLKQSPRFHWLQAHQKGAQRAISALAAAAMAVGINWTYMEADAGSEIAGTLTIAVPTLATAAAGLWEWLVQFSAQQVIYDSVVAGKAKEGV